MVRDKITNHLSSIKQVKRDKMRIKSLTSPSKESKEETKEMLKKKEDSISKEGRKERNPSGILYEGKERDESLGHNL